MKKIRKSRYEYVQLAVGERQYDDIDLSEELIVEARCIKFAVSSDAGNKYIEALPRPRNEMEIPSDERKVADKYYGGIRALLATYENPISEIERRKKTKLADIKLQELLEISSQNAFAEKISRNEIEHGMEIRVQKKNVIQNIQIVTADYSVESIGKCLDKVMNLSTSEGASEQEISRMVLQRLQPKSKDSRPRKVKAKSIDHSVMAKYVME